MTYTTAINAIRTKLNTVLLASGLTASQIAWDNASFDEPEGTWVRVSVLPGESAQMTLGATKRYRTPGIIEIQIFVLLFSGDKTARQIADSIVESLRTVTVSGVTYTTPHVATVGRDGDRWQVNVTCPFHFDTIA